MSEIKWLTASRLTRRTVLKVACTAAATVVAGPALAQQPTQQAPRIKGPRVWLDMDQKELDDAYDQRVCVQFRGQYTAIDK